MTLFVSDPENPWGLPADLASYERLLRRRMSGLDPVSKDFQGRTTFIKCFTATRCMADGPGRSHCPV
jgi:hypothetical protein